MLNGDRALADVLAGLESAPLSEALSALARYATAIDASELVAWATDELEGYTTPCPDYRTVAIGYFDVSGQSICGILDKYATWPLHHGIDRLEQHLKNGLTLRLPAPALQFLSQECGREVFGGHVTPEVLKSLLARIRCEAKQRLQGVRQAVR